MCPTHPLAKDLRPGSALGERRKEMYSDTFRAQKLSLGLEKRLATIPFQSAGMFEDIIRQHSDPVGVAFRQTRLTNLLILLLLLLLTNLKKFFLREYVHQSWRSFWISNIT